MRTALGTVTLLIACMISPGGPVAQDDLYSPSKEQQQQTPPDKKGGGGGNSKPTLASCAVATVAPGPVRKDGLKWDLGKSTGAPDIRIAELTTGTRAACEQTWTCSVTVVPVTNVLRFTLSDNDLDADDEIGEGSCAIGKTCQVGLARVTVKKC